MEHQSLYRRYRPSKFSELIGQRHVVAALRNSVRDNKVGHAYLFSGPRGTGKTSTARILAKALNCQAAGEHAVGVAGDAAGEGTALGAPAGEPCGECQSCEAFASGTSYDLHELDAASNNKVEDVRDLIAKVSFGTPGRRKVYVLDEVHMLTTGAENALLKTLEEPPDHVVFVMCTTEPHKVADTVRSRAQHLRFDLVSAEEMSEHVRWVKEDAGLDLPEDDISYAVHVGAGSVRDTLSALDQVVSAEGTPGASEHIDQMISAIASKDQAQMLSAANDAIRKGNEPRVIAEEIVAGLRSAFLCSVGADLEHLLPQEQELAKSRAEMLKTAEITRAFEELGEALVRMRQAPDPRIDLELALLRLSGSGGVPGGAPSPAPPATASQVAPPTASPQTASPPARQPSGSEAGSPPGGAPPPNQQGPPTAEPTAPEPDDISSDDISSDDITEAEYQSELGQAPPPPTPRDPSKTKAMIDQTRADLKSSTPGGARRSAASRPPETRSETPPDTAAPNSAPQGSALTPGALLRQRGKAGTTSSTTSQATAPSPSEPPARSDPPSSPSPDASASQDTAPNPESADIPDTAPNSETEIPPDSSPTPASPAIDPQDTSEIAAAVGISEETVNKVKEYFPDARPVPIPDKKTPIPAKPPERKAQMPAKPQPSSAQKPVSPKPVSQKPAPQKTGPPELDTPPSREDLTLAWGNTIYDSLEASTRRLLHSARFLESQDGTVLLGLPEKAMSAFKPEQEQEVGMKLAAHFNSRLAFKFVMDDQSVPEAVSSEALVGPATSPNHSADLSAPAEAIADDPTAEEAAEEATAETPELSEEERHLRALASEVEKAAAAEAEIQQERAAQESNIPQDGLFSAVS